METRFFRYVWLHSRRDQLIVLGLVVASLPFYWLSLEIPKRIVNDAIQGRAFQHGAQEARLFETVLPLPEALGGTWRVFEGVLLEQVPYLFALSTLFLGFVLINGWFKYVINIEKGILGERMLRRLRFELFTLVLRFKPEDVRATKSAEVASMVKDEVEPIGGFFGEAFITPAFLGSQAATAMAFILVQNVWLGLVAGAIIAVQALIIPRLRREQIRLGRERQLASRKLAGRIGEMVDAAPALHTFAGGAHGRAEIGDRLGHLFGIRFRLYKRKFAVKYLNNLLAQVTPFIFYAFGGYLALKGRLDVGQLVAIIAAYRDLPTPIKELIDWDQQRADVLVKFEQVVNQFAKDDLLPEEADCDPTPLPPDEPVVFTGVRVVDQRGTTLLERTSLTLDRPIHVAVVGNPGSGRDMMLRLLGRQISDFQGALTIAGRDLARLPDTVACHSVVYCGADPHVTSGTLRDNLMLALRRPLPPDLAPTTDSVEQRRRAEAMRTGNPLAPADADWIDTHHRSVDEPWDIDGRIVAALDIVGGRAVTAQLGMSGPLGTDFDDEVAAQLIEARRAIAEALREPEAAGLVEPFDAERFNAAATLSENLLFGVTVGQRLGVDHLARDAYVRSILDAESLTEPLVEVGARMVETVVDTFPGLAPGHPLFERYGFVDPAEVPELARLLESARTRDGRRRFAQNIRDRLIAFALQYVEARHRLDLAGPDLVERILRARLSFRRFVPANYRTLIEFYDRERLAAHASVSDNLLFGRINYGVAHARRRVDALVGSVLGSHGLEPFVHRRGLAFEAGPSGRFLSLPLRMIVQLTRAVLRRPDILVLDGALNGLPPQQAAQILDALRGEFSGRTLVFGCGPEQDVGTFDRVLTFEGARLASDRDQRSSGPADRFAGSERADTVAGRTNAVGAAR